MKKVGLFLFGCVATVIICGLFIDNEVKSRIVGLFAKQTMTFDDGRLSIRKNGEAYTVKTATSSSRQPAPEYSGYKYTNVMFKSLSPTESDGVIYGDGLGAITIGRTDGGRIYIKCERNGKDDYEFIGDYSYTNEGLRFYEGTVRPYVSGYSARFFPADVRSVHNLNDLAEGKVSTSGRSAGLLFVFRVDGVLIQFMFMIRP